MISQAWKRLTGRAEKKALILMYHQVCERDTDPWDLAVDPRNFDRQLAVLKTKYDVVPLDELAARVRHGSVENKTIAITFDDGFVDNYVNAAPLLNAHRLPATFFVTTNNNSSLYWWDILESLILQTPHLPEVLDLKLDSEIFYFRFLNGHDLDTASTAMIRSWRYGMDIDNERIDLYLKLWKRIQPMSAEQQLRVLSELCKWANREVVTSSTGNVMSNRELVSLSENKLFTIGAHTVNHPMLSAHDESTQSFEISESKSTIQRSLNKTVRGFAYPYGNYSEITKTVVRQSEFDYAVSTESRAVTRYSDPFALPRIQVKNWGTRQFECHIDQALKQ